MNVPWMTMPSSWQSFVKRRANSTRHAFLDVEEDLLIAGLIADQQQTQAIVLHDSRVLRGTLALALHDQVTAELAQLLRERFDTRQVVGQRVIVEKEFLHLPGRRLSPFISATTSSTEAHAITMAATVWGHRQKVQRDLHRVPYRTRCRDASDSRRNSSRS